MNLANRIALVTGGGQGIGRAIALKLANSGASVIINDISLDAANIVAQEIKAMERQSLAIKADVSSTTEVNKMVEEAEAAIGKIDILVNNAGITRDQLLLRMTDEDWDRVLAINLKGVFLCTRAVLRGMLKQRWTYC